MEIVNIQNTSPVNSHQEYEGKDLSLLQSVSIADSFGRPEDYIEYFIYDTNGNLLTSNYYTQDYLAINPNPDSSTYTTLQIDPEKDIKSEGFNRGTILISYNFYRKLFKSSISDQFWIKEISSDRTELRVVRQDLSNLELQQAFNEYSNQVSTKAYYPDFHLNFGNNNTVIGVNVLYALQNGEGSLLLKLYEPLTDSIDIKNTFWIVDKLSEPVTYEVTIEIPIETPKLQTTLRGPNYNIELSEKVNQTTDLLNYSTLFQTNNTASYQQLKSLMEEKGLDINIDYSNFDNYIHFSSAVDRIYNFVYKLTLIESYRADIGALTNVTGNSNTVITSGSRQILQNKIDNVIEKFDGYEYYLYYESSSTAWPKSNTVQPYNLFSVTSSNAINWLGSTEVEPTTDSKSIIYSASLYDTTNKDALTNVVPLYIREDDANRPYITFINMIGQHFDNIWIYLKDVTERFNAENNLVKGISKNLVSEALKGLGIDLYTNTSISDNIYYSMLGTNQDGSLTPPTGSEKNINYYISSSNQVVPGQDITLEYYKRIYHNLPYLLKTKGTVTGLRALINCFGIPDTILKINEFGSSDKLYSTPDLINSRHTLAFDTEGSNVVEFPWAGQNLYYLSASNSSIVPDTIEFRFKTKGITNRASQSIFEVNYSNVTQFGINLLYNTSSSTPSSSLKYNGDLRLYLLGSQGYAKTEPITLPFFDDQLWWNVMLKRETGSFIATNSATNNRYWVYVKGSKYNAEGNNEITFEKSQSIYIDGATSSSYNTSWSGFNISDTYLFAAKLGGADNNGVLSPNGVNGKFLGYFQEFRYWAVPLLENIFDEHVQNSLSYKGNSVTSYITDLTFRAPLGSNLNVPYQSSASVQVNFKDYDLYELGYTPILSNIINSYHPTITGSFTLPFSTTPVKSVQSFISGSTAFSYGRTLTTPKFKPFTVVDLVATPSTGPSQRVNNKVNIPIESNYPENILSPNISIQRPNSDITKTSPDIEIGFSPTDSIDSDITNQLGYFNIDEFIGTPGAMYESTYVELDKLRISYYEKYLSSYKLWDFIRLLKYYDNSLFKMMKDYVPARANLSSGIIIKPTILERPKYPRHEPVVDRLDNYDSSISILSITGSNPGANYLNTSYTSSIVTPLGRSTELKSDLRESFTGEFSGSEITVASRTFSQIEISNINTPWTSSVDNYNEIYTTYYVSPLLNNVSNNTKSNKFLKPDYSSNINIPVNNGLITGALALYETRNTDPLYTGLDNNYWPFAEVQDYNYEVFSRNNPRYEGSKTVSKYYNITSQDDTSYGKTAAIDKIKDKYAYLVDIYTASLGLPGRSDAQIKYLIGNDESTLNLTKANPNLFDIQNIYKSGETIQIALFDYNPSVPETQLLTDNKELQLYEGGFRYIPILHNLSGSAPYQGFKLTSPIEVTVPAGSSANPSDLNIDNFRMWTSGSTTVFRSDGVPEYTGYWFTSASLAPGVSPFSYNITVNMTVEYFVSYDGGGATSVLGGSITLPYTILAGNTYSDTQTYPGDATPEKPTPTTQTDIQSISADGSGGSSSSSSSRTFYTTFVTSSESCIYLITGSNQLVLNSTIAQYYDTKGLTFDSKTDNGWSTSNLGSVTLPLTLGTGDRITFYDSVTSLEWNEAFEYVIKGTSITGSGISARVLVDLDRPVNLLTFTTGSGAKDITTSANYKACRYILFKHVPDETNLILKYSPTVTILQDGLVYPQYLDPTVRNNAGNVLQSLKANNLI